ncbi:hypothetical protein B9G54_05840 [Alloscardovia macacae]|nr:hypothetical protein B9G54_05840 [Alloscardovia macacae]
MFWAVVTVIVMWMAFFMAMVGAHTVSLHPNAAENNHLWDVRIFVVYGLGCIISTALRVPLQRSRGRIQKEKTERR